MHRSPQLQPVMFSRVDALHAIRSERERVNAYLHDGERIAEFSSRALENIRSGTRFAARGIRAVFAKPTRR